MMMYIFPFLWFLLLLLGVKKNATDVKDPFSKEQSSAVRGIAAIEIMLGHIGIYTNSSALLVFRKSGIFFVGIFFALSGYANALNLTEKKDYDKKYLPKRFVHLMVPAYVAFILGLVENSYMARDYHYLLGTFKISVIFDGINWFVWELLLLYIITYLVYIIGKNNKKNLQDAFKRNSIFILIFSIIFVSLAYLVADETWYGSTLCYYLGMILYFYKDKFIELLSRKKFISYICIAGVGITFGLAFYFTGENSFCGNVICRNILAAAFVVLIFALLLLLKIGNVISSWLGKISFEIYLFHNMFLGFIGFFIKEPVILCILVVVSTILFSAIYKSVYDMITKKLLKKFK